MCNVKFDVADVAYPVVSLGKMIESRFPRSALMTTSAPHAQRQQTCGDLSKGPNLRVDVEVQVAGEQGSNGRAR